MYAGIVIVIGAAGVAGCGPGLVPPARASYHCESGSGFVAHFDRRAATATLTFPGGVSLILPQTVSGSGFRYGDGRRALHGKGGEALWSAGDGTTERCRIMRDGPVTPGRPL